MLGGPILIPERGLLCKPRPFKGMPQSEKPLQCLCSSATAFVSSIDRLYRF
jgi:hypothetical protein